MRLRRLAPLALLVALSACPEERADAKRPLPRDRLPPAMPIQPQPSSAPAPAGTDGAEPTPAPAATADDAAGGQPTPAPTPEPTSRAPAR